MRILFSLLSSRMTGRDRITRWTRGQRERDGKRDRGDVPVCTPKEREKIDIDQNVPQIGTYINPSAPLAMASSDS
jgi:hypothetical protein